MSITVINSLAQLDALTANKDAVSVIDFHAVWCGPCKAIAPIYQKLAAQYAGRVQFLKVDVDQVPAVAQKFNVSAMPTFVVLKGPAKVEEMRGANPAGLTALIAKHAPAAGAGAGPSGSGSSQDKGLEGFVSLNSQIDQSQVHCLNESSEHMLKDMLRGGGDKWLESDADEQLLLHIPIQESIKLRALRFTTASSKSAHAPKTVKIFVNAPGVDFDSAEGGAEAAQEFVLDEEQARGEKVVELRFVRFQNVKHLAIFVVDNQGGEDVTRIDKLELVGLAVEGTNMSDLKKLDDE
ncbi:thioredoxin-like protein 1-like protein [Rhodotorula sp. JG-1b]|nr:thioredoxin-like protein 1-like protein [Rhodotorula sp. JG-1b]